MTTINIDAMEMTEEQVNTLVQRLQETVSDKESSLFSSIGNLRPSLGDAAKAFTNLGEAMRSIEYPNVSPVAIPYEHKETHRETKETPKKQTKSHMISDAPAIDL